MDADEERRFVRLSFFVGLIDGVFLCIIEVVASHAKK